MSTRDRWCVFYALGQKLTQLLEVKGQIFGKSVIFQLTKFISQKLFTVSKQTLHQRVLRSILSKITSCSDIFIKYIVMYIIPEGNNAALTGKIARGQKGRKSRLASGTMKKPMKQVYVKNEPHIWSQGSRKSQNHKI